MNTRDISTYMVIANCMISFPGCSAWGPSIKGTAQFTSNDVEGQSKSLAGVYEDVQPNGSLKPHVQKAGVEGRVNGLIILGGPADMPNIKTGGSEIKGSANETPKVTIGDQTFPSGSNSK